MKNKSIIIYEDNSIIAANKPARLASVPAPNIGLGSTLLGRVRREASKTMNAESRDIYPLHRLDYATSGAVLFGKDPKERTMLENIHHQKDTDKIYLALVKGRPPAKGSIDFKVPARHQDVLVEAHTEYRVLSCDSNGLYSLVEIKITTGRKHQIRRHFAMIKFPIVIDDEYGDRKFNRNFRLKFRLGRHFLHAWKISFAHPITGKRISIAAPLPPDLGAVLKRLNIQFGEPARG